MIRVIDLDDDETVVYYSDELGAFNAVRNAFAYFTMKDGNTWDYAKYDHLVKESKHTIICGNWCTLKGERNA